MIDWLFRLPNDLDEDKDGISFGTFRFAPSGDFRPTANVDVRARRASPSAPSARARTTASVL
jgi:hypothetical protein